MAFHINNSRLREARLYRRLTMDELACQVGINKQAISQFENQKTTPEPITLKNIADKLQFPYTFFIEQDPVSIIGNTYFRAFYSSKKKDLVSQQIKTKYLARIHTILSKKVNFKPLNLPDVYESEEMEIEDLAIRVREYWQLGNAPINNMVSLLEQNGIIVGEFSTQSREIDAFYQYYEENGFPTYCVVLGTDKKSFYRRQFNCAHELGHILLHERYSDLNEINREEFRQREEQANAFAAAFLLPADSFGKDVSIYPNRISHYIELKKKWNVSIMAMIMRAYSLGFLTDSQYSYLMKQMSAKGYRFKEPLDDSIEYKHPKALRQAIELLLSKANMSGYDIVQFFSNNNLSITADIIEELLDLPSGMLTKEKPNNIVELPILK